MFRCDDAHRPAVTQQRAARLAGGGVPNLRGAVVAAGRERGLVGTQRGVMHGAAMPHRRHGGLQSGRVPDARGVVVAPCQNAPRVAQPCRAKHHVRMRERRGEPLQIR